MLPYTESQWSMTSSTLNRYLRLCGILFYVQKQDMRHRWGSFVRQVCF